MSFFSRPPGKLLFAVVGLTLTLAALPFDPLRSAGGAAQEGPAGGRDSTTVDPPGAKGRGAEPVELHPRPAEKGRAAPMAAGEVHLLSVLQSLADASGVEVVCPGGRELARQTIRLKEPIPRPDRPSLSAALSAAGYSLSDEAYRGRKVIWITRSLQPSGRRGSIRPAPEGDPAEEEEGAPAASADGAVKLFQSGTGRGSTFLVLFETGSRAEAEEAYQVLQTIAENQQKKRGK